MPRHFSNPRIHYRVKPGSPAMAAIERLNAIDDAHRKAVRALLKELRLPKEMLAFGTDRSIWGISSNPRQAVVDYVAAHPNEWRWDRKTGYGAPRKNTPEGKVIAAKFAALPKGVDGDRMNREIVGVGAFFAGMAIVFCGYYHKKGDIAILIIPAAIVAAAKSKSSKSVLGRRTNTIPVLPKGITEMKQSEALIAMGEMKEEVEA